MKFVLKILKSFYLWKKSLTTTGINLEMFRLFSYCTLLFLPTKEIALLLISRNYFCYPRRYWASLLSLRIFFKNALKSSYFVGQYIIIRRKTGLRGSRLLLSSYCQPILQSESDRCTWTEWKESIIPRFSSSIQNPCKKKFPRNRWSLIKWY